MIRLAAPGAPPGLHIIGLQHAGGGAREPARAAIRAALAELVGVLLHLDPARVAIDSSPGRAPRILVDAGPVAAGMSISHEADWSFAAVFLGGAVGLDVMRIGLTDDWEALARDYLGTAAPAAIGRLPARARPEAFCRAWTSREAHLKCLALALAEWRALKDDVVFFQLQAPPGFVATAVLQPRSLDGFC